MRRITRNRFLDAFLKLILLSGLLHIVILAVVAVKRFDIRWLNYFSIIQADLLVPSLSLGFTNHIVSLIAALLLYALIYLFFSRNQ